MFGTFTLLTALATFGVAQAAPAQVNSGDATFYAPGLGACGQTNSASDAIVAVSQSFFESFPGAGPNPNLNPVCGQKMTVYFQGKSTDVTVVDSCPGCGPSDIDLSPAAFSNLADQSLGRIQVTWTLQ